MKNLSALFIVLLLSGLIAGGCGKGKSRITTAEPEVPTTTDYTYQMGVNLNEQVDLADMEDVSDTKTKWIRCFIEFIDLYKSATINTDPKIAAFTALKSKGYNTVLSLKFNFLANGFPSVNSSDWNNYLNFINTVLDKVMPYTDVLIVGNEPFIEAAQSTWNEPLNSFYRAACDKVHAYFLQNKINKPVFLGAFDNLYSADKQANAGYNNLFAFARATPYLAGVDLHIHHNSDADMATALSFAKNKIRDDQKIVVTEFSLMPYWRSYNNTDISPQFIAAADANSDDRIFPPPANLVKNYQYIDYALKNPRPAQEWYAFWQYSPYLEARKDYLCTAYHAFQVAGDVYLTFYALRQSYPLNADFTVNTAPWVLNGLFVNRSVEQLNGRNQKSYSFLDQFQEIINNQSPCK